MLKTKESVRRWRVARLGMVGYPVPRPWVAIRPGCGHNGTDGIGTWAFLTHAEAFRYAELRAAGCDCPTSVMMAGGHKIKCPAWNKHHGTSYDARDVARRLRWVPPGPV